MLNPRNILSSFLIARAESQRMLSMQKVKPDVFLNLDSISRF